MPLPRWLSALLIAALVLSASPVSVLAAPTPPAREQQAPSVASAPSYLLAVALPAVSVPAGLSGFDAAGYINVQHARRYAEVAARLTRLQEQGAISGFTPLPSAYAFAVTGATVEAQAALPQMGQMQVSNEMSAAAVDELAGAYQRQLSAAVDAATRQAPQAVEGRAVEQQAMPAVLPQGPAATARQPLAAAAVTTPTFQIQLYNNYVYGESLAPNIPVTFTLKSGSGLIKAEATGTSSGFGNVYVYLTDIFNNAAPFLPGDVLEVQAPQLITIPVVDLRLTPDMATGQLTGVAPANIASTDWMTKPVLYLSLASSGYITTTAAGTFAVTSSSPLQPGQYWQLSYISADGHTVYLAGRLPILVLRGSASPGWAQYMDDRYVSGAVVAPNAVVTITLTHAGSPPVVNFSRSADGGSFWHYLRDVYGNPVEIGNGDTVQVTDGVITLAVTAPTFAVTSDPVADTVSGTTNAVVVTDTVDLTQTLAIWPEGLESVSAGKAVPAPGGAFTLGNPFYPYANPSWPPTTLNWGPGARGHLRYIDVAGNVVLADFRAVTLAPILSLRGDSFGYTAENQVYGYIDSAYSQCIDGTVALLDSANAVKDQNIVSSCDYGGNSTFATSFFDLFDNPLPILPGDSVVAVFNGQTTTVVAPPITLSANPATDVVGGSITPGLVVTNTYGAPQSLAVYPSMSSSPWKMVLPDGAGNFSANFTGTYNITPGAAGYVEYIDAGSNSVYAKWQAPFDKPLLQLRGDGGYYADNYVAVDLPQYSCSSDRPLLLAVKTQVGALLWQETFSICGDSIGRYLYDEFGNDIDLQAGDIVEATFAGQMASATVPTIDVQSDAETDTVSGVTNATVVTTGLNLTQTLVIWPEWSSYGKYATVAAGGAFSITNPFYWNGNPLNGDVDLDWEAGQSGYLRYIDAAGNHVYDSFVALNDQPLLTIWKNSNWLFGYSPDGNAPMTVTVKSGATVKGVGYDTSSASGYFEVDIYDGAGNPVEVESGDEIMVSQPMTSVIVPPLSLVADPDTDRISGKGPANVLLQVSGDSFGPRTVTTDANGDYALDLRGQADVEPGDYTRVLYLTAEGHRIYAEAYAGAMLSAALNTDRVWGYAPDEETEITVTVKRGGAVIGSDWTIDSDFFSLAPIDATGKPVLLAAGDVLELDFGAGVIKTLTLSALSLAINVQTEVLSGTGPANSLLGVIADASTSWLGSVTTDAAGAWSANLAAEVIDIRPGDEASVRHSLNGADSTWLYGSAPVFWVYSGTSAISGYAAPYAPVTVTLKRNGGVLSVAYLNADGNGSFWVGLYDVNGLPVSIKAGDVIEVKSAQTVTVTVPPMSITLDAAARMVSGVGPASSLLGVETSAGSKTVTSDATGAWSVDFAPYTNSSLTWAELSYREPQGNWIVANTVQRVGGTARLNARWDADMGEYSPFAVSGSAGAGPRQVVLSLNRGGVIATASDWSGPDGSFSAVFRNAAGDTVDILAGDVIEMVAGDVSKSMTVPALTVQANLESETLFGTGPASTDLYSGGWCGVSTVVDPSGAWVIGCDGLEEGATGHVYVTDLLGNSTHLGWSVPFIRVREHGNEVEGTVALGAEVLVQLLRGSAVIAEASEIADSSNGWFDTEFFSAGGSPVVIQPNDAVVVSAGETITVPVVPLTAVVDSATDRISGVGPANDEVAVEVSTNSTWDRRIATTAADGSYVADFSGALDVRPGDWLQVTHINADGDEVWLGWNAPLVRINLGSDIVDGFATPNSLASLVLKRGGAVIATAEAETDSGGAFSAYFRDASGNLIDLVAGDVVEVTASPTVATAAITLSASVDTRNDIVSGNAPAGALLLVTAYTCSTGGCSGQRMTAIASDAGVYVANFSSVMDLGPTSYAYVEAADGAGNQTSIVTTPLETPLLDATEQTIAFNGAMLTMSSYGTANQGNLTPPQSFNVVGGGRLIFSSRAGSLVITAPDGTITRPDNSFFVIENPRTGKWQVQLEVWSGRGQQYTIAAGLAQYSIYMPTLKRQ